MVLLIPSTLTESGFYFSEKRVLPCDRLVVANLEAKLKEGHTDTSVPEARESGAREKLDDSCLNARQVALTTHLLVPEVPNSRSSSEIQQYVFLMNIHLFSQLKKRSSVKWLFLLGLDCFAVTKTAAQNTVSWCCCFYRINLTVHPCQAFLCVFAILIMLMLKIMNKTMRC